MISSNIVRHLESGGVSYRHQRHARAIDAQGVAHALHVTGARLAKCVIVQAGGRYYISVLPANRRLDLAALATAVDAPSARLASERDFAPLFGDCEPGAEPPFGRLYALPVVLDASFRSDQALVVRAGNHEEALELAYADFVRLEEPLIADISRGDDTHGPSATLH